MLNLKEIDDLENTDFYKNAKKINAEIKSSIVSKKYKIFFNSFLFIPVNLLAVCLLHVSYMEYLIDDISLLSLIFHSFIFTLMPNFFANFIAKPFLYKVANFFTKSNKIKNFFKINNEEFFNTKKIKNIIKKYKNEDLKKIEIISDYFNDYKIMELQEIKFNLLHKYVNYSSFEALLKNKEYIISISNKHLDKKQKYSIFKLIESEIIKGKDRKAKYNPNEVLENINKLEEEVYIKKNKNIAIKNI